MAAPDPPGERELNTGGTPAGKGLRCHTCAPTTLPTVSSMATITFWSTMAPATLAPGTPMLKTPLAPQTTVTTSRGYCGRHGWPRVTCWRPTSMNSVPARPGLKSGCGSVNLNHISVQPRQDLWGLSEGAGRWATSRPSHISNVPLQGLRGSNRSVGRSATSPFKPVGPPGLEWDVGRSATHRPSPRLNPRKSGCGWVDHISECWR